MAEGLRCTCQAQSIFSTGKSKAKQQSLKTKALDHIEWGW